MDEKGHAKGRITSKKIVWTFRSEKQALRRDFKSDKWYTIVETISASGTALPPFIILKGSTSMYGTHLDDTPFNWGFAKSKTS